MKNKSPEVEKHVGSGTLSISVNLVFFLLMKIWHLTDCQTEIDECLCIYFRINSTCNPILYKCLLYVASSKTKLLFVLIICRGMKDASKLSICSSVVNIISLNSK